jgi:hypothetical protein
VNPDAIHDWLVRFRVRRILAGASRDIFSLDLSDPASLPASEAFLAGRLSALTALGVDPRGWVR